MPGVRSARPKLWAGRCAPSPSLPSAGAAPGNRQRLRAAGLTGYRLEWKVPGKPDIAFPGRKIAIFVNGCFWHRCPKCNPSQPKRNVEFWEAKFRRNVERDHAAVAALTQMGWTPITIWECELKKVHIDATMEKVIEQVRAAAPQR